MQIRKAAPRPVVQRAGMLLLLVAVFSGAGSHAAHSAWKPERNVEIVVGAAPGGGVDKTARLIQGILQERKMVEVPVSVVNKPGGGGSIGWTYLNQRPGDAHYVAVTPLNLLTNYITGTSQISPAEITPISLLGSEYIVFTVRTESPIRTGRDLMEVIKKDPRSLNIATATRGGANHIAIASAAKKAGVPVKQLKIVVFKSGGESTTALLGGHVDLVPASASVVAPQIKDGKLRAVAVSSPQRLHGLFADVPTWKEQGIDTVFANWRAAIGPKGMTRAQIDYWDEVFAKVTNTDEWKKDLDKNFWVNEYLNSRESRKYLDAQYGELKAILNDLGMAR